jgi:hypothetical protein
MLPQESTSASPVSESRLQPAHSDWNVHCHNPRTPWTPHSWFSNGRREKRRKTCQRYELRTRTSFGNKCKTILNEFCRVVFRKKINATLEEL